MPFFVMTICKCMRCLLPVPVVQTQPCFHTLSSPYPASPAHPFASIPKFDHLQVPPLLLHTRPLATVVQNAPSQKTKNLYESNRGEKFQRMLPDQNLVCLSFIYNPLHAARRAVAAAPPLPLDGGRRYINLQILSPTDITGHTGAALSPTPCYQNLEWKAQLQINRTPLSVSDSR